MDLVLPVIAGLLWLLKGSGKKTLPTAQRQPGLPTTPTGAKWPATKPEPGQVEVDAAEMRVQLAQQQLDQAQTPAQQVDAHKERQAALQDKLNAQVDQAKKRAGSDKRAQADIEAKRRAQQKALDDYKRDIANAQGG